ncbi:MAG TPA: hypothetical protein VJP04_11810 [Terriglobales bacterium]|nr:hypothetical protein [Terriglobales bacterium]
MEPTSKTVMRANAAHGPFHAGAMVLLALGEPREKFWGQLLALSEAGISLRGIDLESFDDSAAMIKAGEPFTPSTVFFPMHRVERMELDVHAGGLPSLSERFRVQTGRDPVRLFGDAAAPGEQE